MASHPPAADVRSKEEAPEAASNNDYLIISTPGKGLGLPATPVRMASHPPAADVRSKEEAPEAASNNDHLIISTPGKGLGLPAAPLRSIEGLKADPADVVAPRMRRVVIFALFCQAVQMFMSYDGGATPASLDTIQETMGSWTETEFGILGAIDKIGMTISAAAWGRALQFCNAKLLLCIGLALNAGATALFGTLQSKLPMYGAKLVMGMTQSLQGIWATVWTVSMAPPEQKTMWLGMGGLSAGIGNGLGTAVAGFATANGLPYSLAFWVQASVLAALLLALLLHPARWLVMELPRAAKNDDPESCHSVSANAPENAMTPVAPVQGLYRDESDFESMHSSLCGQVKAAMSNQIYLWTCLAISVNMFEMSGIQFIWVRVFTTVWGLNKNFVTTMLLVTMGVGSGLGLAVGPAYIDRSGGFSRWPGVVKSLYILRQFSLISFLGGLTGIACLYGKNRSLDSFDFPHEMWGDAWLWVTFVAVALVLAARNASVPALFGINMEVVPDSMRSFASGLEMTLRNILGYACATLLPGIVMDISMSFGASTEGSQLGIGLAFVLSANFLDYFILTRAKHAAGLTLASQRQGALALLRTALQAEDVWALKKAVDFARSVDLHQMPDGEAVLGMANQAIGAFEKTGCKAFQGAVAFTATREELYQRVLELERRNAMLEEQLILVSAPSESSTACPSSSFTAAAPDRKDEADGEAAWRRVSAVGPPFEADAVVAQQVINV